MSNTYETAPTPHTVGYFDDHGWPKYEQFETYDDQQRFLTACRNAGITCWDKPYKDGVTLDEIVEDGWSRNFSFAQVIEEAGLMGYQLSEETLSAKWEALNKKMLESFGLSEPVDEIDLALALLCAHHDKGE